MELRQPPQTPTLQPPDRVVRCLLIANLAVVVVIAVLLVQSQTTTSGDQDVAARQRQVASKLKAAGVLDQAAALYEQYLAAADASPEAGAKIAYSIATTYQQRGDYARALRWFYEAEILGPGNLSDEVSQKIVSCLERLGRHHAAQSALDARVQLDTDEAQRATDDPVVARIGDEEIHRSDIQRALDDLPPELAASFDEPSKRPEFLKNHVAEELLWRKATKLEYDRDPEVLNAHAAMLRQLAVSKFVEREVVGKIEVDEADLKTYFEANRDRYAEPPKEEGGEPRPLSYEEARPLVERDYRMVKIQSAYGSIIESELATKNVELYPERL
jgi:tetratricopeptide (TPR) repeat protein